MGFANMGPEVKIIIYARNFSMYNTTIQHYNNTTIQQYKRRHTNTIWCTIKRLLNISV